MPGMGGGELAEPPEPLPLSSEGRKNDPAVSKYPERLGSGWDALAVGVLEDVMVVQVLDVE